MHCERQMRLKVLGVVDHIILGYPQKGHTHGPLDATFGQRCVKIGNEEFNSADEVVSILQAFLDQALMESTAEVNKVAYKLDESPSWERWWDELQLNLTNLTGPLAPHWFQICSRRDLDVSAMAATETAWPGAPPSQPGDIVCAVKDRLASVKAYQIALVVPAAEIAQLKRNLSVQPAGLHPRREIGKDDRKKIVARAAEALKQHLIPQTAHDFLVGWANGTLPKVSRPETYNFLNHRYSGQTAAMQDVIGPRFLHISQRVPRLIQVNSLDGRALPLDDGHEEEEAMVLEGDR